MPKARAEAAALLFRGLFILGVYDADALTLRRKLALRLLFGRRLGLGSLRRRGADGVRARLMYLLRPRSPRVSAAGWL